MAFASVGAAQTRLASGTVQTLYRSWLGSAPSDASSQLKYAIGGATAPSSTDLSATATSLTSNSLSITAIVRTNDTNLSVFGQSAVNLADGPWSTNDVARTTTQDQTGAVPGTTQRQTFTTPRGAETKKFLRLQTTIGGQSP